MKYDFDLIVIGAGSGGVRTARTVAKQGVKVAIIEEALMGGTCVNVGCVPKKLFTYAAKFAKDFKDSNGYGWNIGDISFNWKTLIQNKNKEIQRLNQIYRKLIIESNVTIIDGRATFKNKNTIIVNNKDYTAEKILIACGSTPNIPDIKGAELGKTSFDMFYLDELPKDIVIVGGGYISLEFAGIFNNLGSNVTVIIRKDKILQGFDCDVQEFLLTQMKNSGINFLTNNTLQELTKQQNDIIVHTQQGNSIKTDLVLFATGRKPYTDNLNLENIPISTEKDGSLSVNKDYQTKCDSVYAIGDVLNRVQLTPIALEEAMVFSARNYENKNHTVNYDIIPATVFSSPEVGTCGLTEQQAKTNGYDIQIFKSEFRPMKNTLSGNPMRTLMKLIVDKNSDKVLGAHMVGDDSAEIMQGLGIALTAGLTKQDFDKTIGIHPSSAEEFVTMRTPVS